MTFPKDFTWGVSTSSYQIEGAAYEDGKGLSVWDTFCRKEGAVWHKQNGDIACDHYHQYESDIDLLETLKVKAYRFSLAWPRVLPNGVGAINEKGMSFYDKIIDSLLSKGIEPYVTLFHWDYPYELYKRGGWLNSSSSDWFAEYTEKMVKHFGDRVKNWFTLNEPQCPISLGHYQGMHAPGLRLSLSDALLAGHNMLLAHGKSVQAIRSLQSNAKIGYSIATQVRIPASRNESDIDAGRKAMHGVLSRDLWNNSWWSDPVFFGRYPEDGLSIYGKDAPKVNSGDMEIIKQPIDYFGQNVYTAKKYSKDADGNLVKIEMPQGYNRTAQDDWIVEPESIYWTVKFMYERYKTPILITENGHQNLDSVSLDGKVHDPQRVDYLHRHLNCLKRAIDEGIPVPGYFAWTLLDNFEWSFGYKVRVGLVYTDYETLKRTPKDSFYFYKNVIESNGSCLNN